MSLKLSTAATCLATLACLSLSASTIFHAPNAQAQTATSKLISKGDKAPDFSLPSENGSTVKPSDFKGKILVIFFYDKDSSPVTEQESKRIKDTYKKLKLAMPTFWVSVPIRLPLTKRCTPTSICNTTY